MKGGLWQYTLKRLVQGVITVWFIATATFLAMHAVPGNPLDKPLQRVLPKAPLHFGASRT